GQVDRALGLYQQSLELYESIGNVQGKATTLHNMAGIYAQQGQVDRALGLYQQSLELKESIGDVQGKATTLHNMAGIYADQGQVDRALGLYQQSLELKESIGDVKGKAATLNNMSYLAFQQGDQARAVELLRQTAQTLAEIYAYPNLITVLGNLGEAIENDKLNYLAQALWLSLRIQDGFTNRVSLVHRLFQNVPQADALEPLLAALALLLCNGADDQTPDLEQWRERAVNMLAYAAKSQGVDLETGEQLQAWMTQNQLTDPNVFLPPLYQALEAMVGERWLFNRQAV
ncbi:MAG: tetratricopeptide repeat protein, partial [Pegethrix bostrychoides GSE-TBD4-15B]|nr:tetratricopeptide repeat protein [Pegethrix bostrychoides GSE-TBD4-15B]